MATLSMNPVINVSAYVSVGATTRAGLGLGLIMCQNGPATEDVPAEYSSTAEMLAAGYAATDDAYLAATVYFAQSPAPKSVLVYKMGEIPAYVNDLTACRTANEDWFAVYFTSITAEGIKAVAAYAETATPKTLFFFDTSDADVLSGASGNVLESLKNSGYKNTFGMYSTSKYAACSAMAYSLGANSLMPNSFYTMDAKTLPGIATENITEAQANTIKGNNGNVYVSRGGTYSLLENGVVSSGVFYDEVVGIYALTDEIQRSCLDLITSTAKIPQTDLGVNQLVNAINSSCQKFVDAGFIAPGVWNGGTVMNLNNGDALSNGYLVQAQPVSAQTAADREARKSPVIYVCCKLAGAVHSVVISLNINR